MFSYNSFITNLKLIIESQERINNAINNILNDLAAAKENELMYKLELIGSINRMDVHEYIAISKPNDTLICNQRTKDFIICSSVPENITFVINNSIKEKECFLVRDEQLKKSILNGLYGYKGKSEIYEQK